MLSFIKLEQASFVGFRSTIKKTVQKAVVCVSWLWNEGVLLFLNLNTFLRPSRLSVKAMWLSRAIWQPGPSRPILPVHSFYRWTPGNACHRSCRRLHHRSECTHHLRTARSVAARRTRTAASARRNEAAASSGGLRCVPLWKIQHGGLPATPRCDSRPAAIECMHRDRAEAQRSVACNRSCDSTVVSCPSSIFVLRCSDLVLWIEKPPFSESPFLSCSCRWMGTSRSTWDFAVSVELSDVLWIELTVQCREASVPPTKLFIDGSPHWTFSTLFTDEASWMSFLGRSSAGT